LSRCVGEANDRGRLKARLIDRLIYRPVGGVPIRSAVVALRPRYARPADRAAVGNCVGRRCHTAVVRRVLRNSYRHLAQRHLVQVYLVQVYLVAVHPCDHLLSCHSIRRIDVADHSSRRHGAGGRRRRRDWSHDCPDCRLDRAVQVVPIALDDRSWRRVGGRTA
jgi:hypothetical protein